MVSEINTINNIEQNSMQPQFFQKQKTKSDVLGSLSSFDQEDQAIISSEAKLLSELDKFNSEKGNAVDLALASVNSKITVEAEANVIHAKKEMIDCVLDMCD